MVLSGALVAASLASLVAASPLQQRQAGQNGTACAQVAASVAAQSAVPTPSVDAKLAYECITSVPLHKDAALKLVDGVVPYIKWQSNTAWLKDPPKEYAEKVQPAIDVWGVLGDIKSKVEKEEYKSEWEVNHHHIIVVGLNGSMLFCLEMETGKQSPSNPIPRIMFPNPSGSID